VRKWPEAKFSFACEDYVCCLNEQLTVYNSYPPGVAKPVHTRQLFPKSLCLWSHMHVQNAYVLRVHAQTHWHRATGSGTSTRRCTGITKVTWLY
jgi:hypothetical protein